MRRRWIPFLACLVLAGCAAPEDGVPPDVAAVREVTMAGPRISWEELDIHPALVARACAVSTLVNRHGMTVGYCQDGRQCRTMDWRPIEDGCQRSAGRF